VIGDTSTVADCVRAKVRFCIAESMGRRSALECEVQRRVDGLVARRRDVLEPTFAGESSMRQAGEWALDPTRSRVLDMAGATCCDIKLP
jgi:hypothetical protein